MRISHFSCYTLGVCAAAMLAGCGGGSGALGLSPARLAVPQTSVHPAYGVIYSFKGYPYDGANPYVGLISVKGRLYGATDLGGAYSTGTAFSITPSGKETLLHSFEGGKDGANPTADPVAVESTLYGTTTSGGRYSNGTAFTISSSGKEKPFHSFGGGSDGANPTAGLIDVKGALYGTTQDGGANHKGTVFVISSSDKEAVLHSFGGLGDGALPTSGLIDVKGTLYGTTQNGGKNCKANGGCGSIFKMRPSGGYELLYSFVGGSDGAFPYAGLVEVDNTLYGTTINGGGSKCGDNQGCGTVFKMSISSGKEAVLYSFKGDNDGEYPYAGLLNVNGTLYGTTKFGGGSYMGTVFKISLASGKEDVLHSFAGSGDGANPLGGLTERNGGLYGTTEYGGAYLCYAEGCGTVFSLSP